MGRWPFTHSNPYHRVSGQAPTQIPITWGLWSYTQILYKHMPPYMWVFLARPRFLWTLVPAPCRQRRIHLQLWFLHLVVGATQLQLAELDGLSLSRSNKTIVIWPQIKGSDPIDHLNPLSSPGSNKAITTIRHTCMSPNHKVRSN